jgi:luciferase family oxidoreductase group 1
MGLKLSILDQSPVGESESGHQALQHTIELAQKAEEWGYYRFWVAEHHDSPRYTGSSPEVLVSHLLARTNRIRVGSGGVMLQHYSPYKVAENFNVLASLAPGRVDLGIGRGPGGLPRSTRALQSQAGDQARPFSEKLRELEQFLHNRLEPDHPLHGLQARPAPSQPADLYLLGTTPASAQLAAELGLPYVFARFLNSADDAMSQSIELYRREFHATGGVSPRAMLALPVMVADTDEAAARHAAEVKVVRLTLASGRTFTVGSEEAAAEFGRQSQEEYTVDIRQAPVVHGSPDAVREQLLGIQRRYEVEEIIVVTAIRDFPQRLRSYRLLAEAMLDPGHARRQPDSANTRAT